MKKLNLHSTLKLHLEETIKPQALPWGVMVDILKRGIKVKIFSFHIRSIPVIIV